MKKRFKHTVISISYVFFASVRSYYFGGMRIYLGGSLNVRREE